MIFRRAHNINRPLALRTTPPLSYQIKLNTNSFSLQTNLNIHSINMLTILVLLSRLGYDQKGVHHPKGRGCLLIEGLVRWINFGPLRKFPLSHHTPRYKKP